MLIAVALLIWKNVHLSSQSWSVLFNIFRSIGAQCATQAGIEGLATCLRQELRPRGVDVSIIAAGEFASGTAWLSESSMLEQVRSSEH